MCIKSNYDIPPVRVTNIVFHGSVSWKYSIFYGECIEIPWGIYGKYFTEIILVGNIIIVYTTNLMNLVLKIIVTMYGVFVDKIIYIPWN